MSKPPRRWWVRATAGVTCVIVVYVVVVVVARWCGYPYPSWEVLALLVGAALTALGLAPRPARVR